MSKQMTKDLFFAVRCLLAKYRYLSSAIFRRRRFNEISQESERFASVSTKRTTVKSFQEHAAQSISLNFNYDSVSLIDFSISVFHINAGVVFLSAVSVIARTFKMTKRAHKSFVLRHQTLGGNSGKMQF